MFLIPYYHMGYLTIFQLFFELFNNTVDFLVENLTLFPDTPSF